MFVHIILNVLLIYVFYGNILSVHKGGILLFENVSKLQLTLSFVMVFIGFSQAFNNWGEKRTLSLFFLTSSILVLILAIIALMVYRKRANM